MASQKLSFLSDCKLVTNYQDSGIDLQGHSEEDLSSGQGTRGKPRHLIDRVGQVAKW